MIGQLLSDEVAASLGKFFFGAGPSHATVTRCFTACGLSDEDPYDVAAGTPNKEHWVLLLCRTAPHHPGEPSSQLKSGHELYCNSFTCAGCVAFRCS